MHDLVDGRALVSLIAFDFLDTRVRGRRIPGFVDFPEINFRTYVREGDRQGVVAIRELVPSPLAAAIGRLRFNEPFRAAPIESRTASMGDELLVEHRWTWKDRQLLPAHDVGPVVGAGGGGGAGAPPAGSTLGVRPKQAG